MNKRRLTIYLLGVLLGCIILLLIPRKPKQPAEPHPWAAQTAPYGYYPRTVSDDLGRDVELARQPRLLVSLAPSITDMMASMGMADHLVGITRWCDNAQVADVPRIGGLDSPDIERILELRADLVVGTEMTPSSVYERLAAVGVPAIAFRHQGLDDVLNDMRQLSLILGVPRLGLEATSRLEARQQAIVDALPPGGSRPTVAVLYDFDTFGSAGKGTWVNDLLLALRLDNIAAAAQSPWPTLSRESVLAQDPDYIILPRPRDPAEGRALDARINMMKADPVWSRLRAVAEGRIVILSPNSLSVPGPRAIRTLEEIARGVYGVEVSDAAAPASAVSAEPGS